jgi:hypothetical protein
MQVVETITIEKTIFVNEIDGYDYLGSGVWAIVLNVLDY